MSQNVLTQQCMFHTITGICDVIWEPILCELTEEKYWICHAVMPALIIMMARLSHQDFYIKQISLHVKDTLGSNACYMYVQQTAAGINLPFYHYLYED